MKYIIAITFCVLSFSLAKGNCPTDSLYKYDFIGEAHMFMCPFLSPKYMNYLKEECGCEVFKSADLIIHLINSKRLDEEKVLKKAEEIGYEKKNITIKIVE